MIISRTPLRVSLFGGGTDFEKYYKVNGGEVVSFAIDKSIYVAVNKRFDGRLHLRYSKTELVPRVAELNHDLIKECLKYMEIKSGIELVISSDVPSVGTGLGSSGSLTVGTLAALFAYKDVAVSNLELADIACKIEIEKLGAPIGKQDQYACAIGGFNHILFHKDGMIEVVDLCEKYGSLIGKILSALRLFYVPAGRKSAKVLKVYSRNIDKNRTKIDINRSLVSAFLDKLKMHVVRPEDLGILLNKAWKIKKENSPASTELIEKAFEVGNNHGLLGGKICGAGAGGFMLAISEVASSGGLIEAMEEAGFKNTEYKLWHTGSEIIYRG